MLRCGLGRAAREVGHGCERGGAIAVVRGCAFEQVRCGGRDACANRGLLVRSGPVERRVLLTERYRFGHGKGAETEGCRHRRAAGEVVAEQMGSTERVVARCPRRKGAVGALLVQMRWDRTNQERIAGVVRNGLFLAA